MRVVILIPRREDGGWRDRLWAHCREIWEREFPDWPIYEGHHLAEEGPFNRSAGINRAAAQVDDWDVALIIDGDTISDAEAIKRSVERAHETGGMCLAHDRRLMLNKRGTDVILAGRRPNLRMDVRKIWSDTVSCAVAVRRDTWGAVRGFDERFVGWGYEDTAFHIACETVTGIATHHERADCLHLWHESPPEATRLSPTLIMNGNLKLRYQAVHWDREGLEAVLNGDYETQIHTGPIPKILHRTLPARVDAQVEAWWADFSTLHPDWDLRTWRDPLDPADFPLTAHLHAQCANGAQKAGLVRLELLVTHGGVYVDSDVQPIRPLDPLMHLPAFAAWEDERVVPDAVMGAAPQHPAFRQMLARAMRLIELGNQNAWETGPGGTTEMLPGRDDVLLLPPGSFYPVHYKEKTKLGTRNDKPWVFLEHKWHHSWGTAAQKTENAGEAPTPEFVVCMPWRDDGDDWRRRAHEWCLSWWERHGIRVYEGSGQSRAEMCNSAARDAIADGAEILLFADADTWAPIAQVNSAIRTAAVTGHLTHAFTTYVKIGSSITRRYQQQENLDMRRLTQSGRSRRDHVSGLSAISVDLWEKIGGFDERFTQWGFEDQAFHLAAWTLGAGVERVDGPAIHWYHKDDPTKSRDADLDSLDLVLRYCQAAAVTPAGGRTGRYVKEGRITVDPESDPSPPRMSAILSEPGGPLSGSLPPCQPVTGK